ncbi:hypothetical protein OCH239_00205 [Roseivivax halodurans JCM 10272]|uniref:Uncharacterized protein n=1 Tax=Roseivivax halodurans JCM 10272 TaxID=1449350 RepID=X7ENE8_9RHOB|nr:FliH/SctL family protein [Roseivivax halodurans]ETX16698.1 hypothetical protein OCH239_00205 [Roseivivax halodurans JCM 10272]
MRFFFERDFDRELEIESGETPSEAAGVIAQDIEERIAEARAAGFAEGEASGRAAAEIDLRGACETRQAEALTALSSRLKEFVAEADMHRAKLEIELVDFALAVCERLAPEAVVHFSEPRLRDELQAGLKLVQGEGRVRVRVALDLRDRIEADIAKMAGSELAARVEVSGDAGLAAGDVRLEWDNGFMEYSFAATCDRLISALDTLAGGESRPAPFRRAAHA